MRDTPENRTGRHRKWKGAIDGESQRETPREDLSKKQKDFIKDVWRWASTALLGMNKECIPNAVPQYSEEKGWYYTEAKNPHIHHRVPVGFSDRVLDEPYNNLKNFVPVDASNHVGTNAHPDQFVIHKDTQEANEAYGAWVKGGKQGPSPYEQMGYDRRQATKHGDIYHDARLDSHLEKLADWVYSAFHREHPDKKFPTKRGNRTVINEWDEQSQSWIQREGE